jgi:hypothetical protein
MAEVAPIFRGNGLHAATTGRSSLVICGRKPDGHDLDSVKWPGHQSPVTLSVIGRRLTSYTDKPQRLAGAMKQVGLLAVIVFLGSASTTAIADKPSDDHVSEMAADLMIQQADGVMQLGNLQDAESFYSMAIEMFPGGAKPYEARAKVRFKRKNYTGAIEDLNVYLSRSPKDERMLLLRSISKSLLSPEDVVGACADLLRIKELGVSLESLGANNTGKYCKGQLGWDGV